MTAKLERDMLSITDGGRTLEEVVNESQSMLRDVAVKIDSEKVAIGDEIKAALKKQQFVGMCPSCGNSMTIKKSKNGNFIGCNGYPECKRAYPLPKGALIQMTDSVCPVCGLAQIKVIRKGVPPSLQCIDPKCTSNTEKNDLGHCPTCGKGTIRIMYSKAGRRFAGCSEWPACTQTYPLRPRGTVTPTGEACPECGAPVLQIGSMKECINMDCPLRKKRKQTGTETEKTSPAPAGASGDDRVGRVVTVVVSDRKKTARKTAKKASPKSKASSGRSEKPVLESTDE